MHTLILEQPMWAYSIKPDAIDTGHRGVTVKAASTPIETNKALNKDEEAEDVYVHLYRSMIGSLMYLIASRHDIMFAVYACERDLPFDLEAFSDSDYARASLDRKSTIGVFHSKTKHIEIRHHFIKDSYEKKLIHVIKIHTDQNVADLLTKAFDVSRIGVDTARHKLNTASINPLSIEQFWQTASVSTLENGDMEITATIDGKFKVVYEASIRRHLRLEDSDGISTLPT
ncbi:hypothetical protein Tco_1153484 [Tanacetum coccineum]